MIKPNYLEKLLEGVAVEWKPLGEVCENIFSGKNKKRDNKGVYPIYGSTGVIGRTSNVVYETEHILVARVGANAGYVHVAQGQYDVSDNTLIVQNKEDIILKFLYYLLVNMNLNQFAKGAGQPLITAGQLKSIQIPVPCPENQKKSLEIQTKIVCILDAFTKLTEELTEELTDELTSRKKQYEYYRDKLLTFDEGEVEWKTLGDVTLPTSNIRWRDTKDTYRYIDLTSVSREKHTIIETTEISAENAPSRAQKLVIKNDVIFATTRPTQQRLCLITEEFSGGVASTGYCILRAREDEVLPKWIYYCITSSKFKNYVEENQSGSAYPAISDAKVKKFKIPTPPLTEQNRIVSILDKFESLTFSITASLPREIELRQRQYEYYRNLLLSFPKSEVEV